MNHLHMLLAVIVLPLFIYQSLLVLRNRTPIPRPVKIANHIVYALILVSGAWLLLQLLSVQAPIQWVIAKLALFIAAISASLKAFKPTATVSQSRAGIFIAAVAYVGIVILAILKPGNLF